MLDKSDTAEGGAQIEWMLHNWVNYDVVNCLAILAKALCCFFSQIHVVACICYVHQENNKHSSRGFCMLFNENAGAQIGSNG